MSNYNARISRVAYTWLGSTPPKLSATKRPILRKSTERSSAGLYPMYAGLWTLTRTYSCMVRDWPVKQKQIANITNTLQQEKTAPLPDNQPAALLTSEGPQTRLRCRVRPHAIFPRGR